MQPKQKPASFTSLKKTLKKCKDQAWILYMVYHGIMETQVTWT